ncbi:SUMF1/EgtB/PvdO family nonheme iron enzyme [bacterium]|nr:SUMF1/EgtB/PvdO family nonheme iron enzyme [bacterium]
MAPEQYESPEKVDLRSDLFALGIMAYELMTGGRIPSCSLQHILKTREVPHVPLSQIPPPSEFCAIVPPALDRLVLQLLSYDQESRPRSATEVSRVLGHIQLDTEALAGAGVGKTSGETVRIPGGASYLGSGPDSEYPAEKPMRRVTLSPYEISVTPATNRDYRLFLQATGYEAPPLIDHPVFGADDHPVVSVSWHDAMTYAKWAGGSIPTEAQWECAAKACERISTFPWGNSPPEVSQANIAGVSSATTQVYSYPSGRNPLGLWDMCGNVWDWCLDTWDESYYRKLDNNCVDPRSNGDSSLRSIRGGSYESFVTQGRCVFRHFREADDHRPDIGFRVVYNDR